LNSLVADTRAFIADRLTGIGNGLTINSTAPDTADKDEISVVATRHGLLVSVSAAISANMNSANVGTGAKAYSGSVSLNRLNDKARAIIDGVSILSGQDVGVHARDDAYVTSVGGGVAYSAGAVGFGGSIGVNYINADTQAGVTGERRRSLLTISGGLTV